MALTPSTMLPLGTPAPAFSLADTTGKTVSLSDLGNTKALLVMFICNHCPFVKHVREGLIKLAKDYQFKGVTVIGINSNDAVTHPDDSAENMARDAKTYGYPFAYLYDETQEVAKAYRAACTPDFFLFGADRKLVYRGQLDSSRPNNGIPVTGGDLRAALDAVLAGKPVSQAQIPSMGCNIKWKSGNAPSYA